MARRVLVVDDEWLIFNFARSALEELGCEVVTASDATEGLQKLRMDGHIELLITDIQMPGMDGAELVERAKGLRPTLKVIVTSGRRDAPPGVLNAQAIWLRRSGRNDEASYRTVLTRE
jgi:CheY-like chemotaxis protein